MAVLSQGGFITWVQPAHRRYNPSSFVLLDLCIAFWTRHLGNTMAGISPLGSTGSVGALGRGLPGVPFSGCSWGMIGDILSDFGAIAWTGRALLGCAYPAR